MWSLSEPYQSTPIVPWSCILIRCGFEQLSFISLGSVLHLMFHKNFDCHHTFGCMLVYVFPSDFGGFPVSSVVKNPPAMQETPWFYSWVGKICWRRDRLPTPVFLGFPAVQLVKNPPAIWKTWV